MMKIAILISFYPLPGESPHVGPDNVVFNLVKGLVRLDSNISIDIVTILNDVKKAFVDERFPCVRVYYLPRLKYLSRSFSDQIIIKKFLKKHDYDIVHAHYPIALAKIFCEN